MPTPDDPFEFDPDRTVIRPMPGRRTEAPPPVERKIPLAPAGPSGSEDVRSTELVSIGVNPVVAAATPLIAMAVRLRGSATQRDVPALRDRIVRELKRFEQTLRSSGIPPETLRTAHYTLCATIDDLVLNTPWGQEANWRAQSLCGVFHNDVRAGERFFDILRQLGSDPSRHIEVLVLMYLCLSLGFEGRFRVLGNGPAELARIREDLFNTIRQLRGDFERELSPHWQGIPASHKPLSSKIPLWVFACASGVLLMVIFIGFSFALSTASNPVFAKMSLLPPGEDVAINGGTALPKLDSHALRLREFLAPEISARIVEVNEDERTITISIHGSGTFAVGNANLENKYREVLQRIGAAIQNEPGQVKVTGHTDSTPIRTVPFPSNYELSLARADAARDVIRAQLSDPGRVVAEGRADTQPVASNQTPEGRELNRRIEITLLKPLAG
jgi:type VI secretion system protein ImpK